MDVVTKELRVRASGKWCFTAFAESEEPEEMMAVLSEFHGEMGRLIMQYEAKVTELANKKTEEITTV